MTIAARAIEGIRRDEALLDSTATTVANLTGLTGLASDEVSLSDTALALIQARIGMAANASLFHTAVEMEKALIDVRRAP